jgi:acyl-CoA synthetase (AMP-forming)/AMP-acid ligase II
MTTIALHELLGASAARFPEHVAVEESDHGCLRYAELARLSDRVRDRLSKMGVREGDRVGLCLRKSADAVAALFGIMKAGAAYVPVDPTAPATRSAYIFRNCAVKALIVEESLRGGLQREFEANDFRPGMIVLGKTGAGLALKQALDLADAG